MWVLVMLEVLLEAGGEPQEKSMLATFQRDVVGPCVESQLPQIFTTL